MNESQDTKKRRISYSSIEDAFKPGEVLFTGERKFSPLRQKKNDSQTFEPLPSYFTDTYLSQNITDEDAREIRKENKIILEGNHPPKPILNFEDIGLTQSTLQLLYSKHIHYPTGIQMQAIPCICSGRDVLLLSETGSGKTLSYVLPLIIRLQKRNIHNYYEGPSSLILAPTKELVNQIYDELKQFFQDAAISMNPYEMNMSSTIVTKEGTLAHRVYAISGGTSLASQIAVLHSGIDILVSTPGRCIDLIQKHQLILDNVEYLVVDECDKMVDISIEQQLRTIISFCLLNQRQTILCSATLPVSVERLLKSALFNYFTIHIKTKNTTLNLPKNIQIYTYYIENITDHFSIFLSVLKKIQHPPVIVFVNNKTTVDELTVKLRALGFKAAGIHSNLSPEMRTLIFNCFKQNGIDVLISTDLLSRGIDISMELSICVYDMPYTIEDYIHRVGRTGRQNKYGAVYTFITINCRIAKEYRLLLKQTHQEIPKELEREDRFGPLLQNDTSDKINKTIS